MKCKQCGKPHNNKAFCSHKCRNEWIRVNNLVNNPIHNPKTLEKMRLSLTGKKLPEEVKAKMSATRKKLIKHNPDLLKKMQLGAEEKYLSRVRGTSWTRVRIRALERDDYKCTKCSEPSYRRLVVHHIDWQGKNLKAAEMNNDLSNLQTLCYKCHNNIHRHRAKDYHIRKSEIAP